ncbi:MAG: hypothetical protein H0V51_06465, partial [Chloroflexi bacterium]|nr:hypothetical protein [Chloroflexota bacterium]
MLLSRVVALAVDLRPGEGRLTALLLLLSALLGFVRVYLNTAAIALFLTVFGAGDLPYLFIASAAASALTGLAFSKAQDRLPLSRLLTATLAILLVTIGLLRALLLQTEAEWPTMALAVWNEVIFVIAVLAFWALAEQLVNVRQAKRLFGVIGAGEVAASIVGGFTLPFLVDQIGTKNLVLAAAVAAALSFCVLQVIVRSFGGAIDGGEEASGVAPNERETGAVRLRPTDRYFLLIAGVCALNTVGFYVVDTAYFAETERQYPDEDELAAFLGVIEAVSSAITLVGRTFMTGRVLSRFGVTLGLLTLPLVVSVGTLAIVGTASVGGASALVFWLMVLTKVNFGCLHESLDRPSILVLYQPLPPLDRLRAQTWVETITDPLALGLTGGVLLLFEAQFGLSAISLSFLILLVVLLWATVAMFIGRSYLAALQRALAKRYLGGGTRLVKDRSMTAVLEKGLGSRHPGEVIYSLNVLEELEHESLPLFLESLLEHPVATVRQDVLARIERLDLSALADRVLDGVERDPSPAVRAVALQAYAALGRAGVVEQVTPYLGHPEPDIRVGALIGLL